MSEDGWTSHDGGPCPVEAEQQILYRTRRGEELHSYAPERLDWDHIADANHFDIIAYRLVEGESNG